MMLSDRHPILLANARIVDPSRDLDIVGDLLIAEGTIREAKKGIGAAGVPEGTDESYRVDENEGPRCDDNSVGY